MLIKKVHIEKFRGFHDQKFEVGSMLTAIAGQNGTQKSTLLGIPLAKGRRRDSKVHTLQSPHNIPTV